MKTINWQTKLSRCTGVMKLTFSYSTNRSKINSQKLTSSNKKRPFIVLMTEIRLEGRWIQRFSERMTSWYTGDSTLFLLRACLSNWLQPMHTCRKRCVWLTIAARLTWKERDSSQLNIWKSLTLLHWRTKRLLTPENLENSLSSMRVTCKTNSFRHRSLPGFEL